jgi:DNA polymerase I-like protein with 3'-5' exonuclease and polymerase domains
VNILVLDIENTVSNRNGRKHLDPFEPDNTLVMIGCKWVDKEVCIYTFDHAEVTNKSETINEYRQNVQSLLDEADLLVGHNISHDLVWLWESGFKYDGKVFDTMLAEYVLLRGQNMPLDLGSVATRYGTAQKQDTLKEYFKKGYSTREIPLMELQEYLLHDLLATQGIFEKISVRLQTVQDEGLHKTIELTNEVSVVLSRIYQTGFKVDKDALEEVRKEFEQEKAELERDLNGYVRTLMGDTPINLNSPEQLSWIVFSRKPKDKAAWAKAYTPYMPDADFKAAVKRHFDTLFKTKAVRCATCNGTGYIQKVRKDGTLFKKSNKCPDCNGGYNFVPTKEIAGLKFSPPSVKWASANGFGTDKGNLEILERVATSKGMEEASKFLSGLRRLSALDSYLSSFVGGISDYLKPSGLLHARLNQHITATGRFSGSNPNFQNFPRGKTFPIKRVFISRWADQGGKIMEADFAQLEFRVAAFLSQDPVAMKEVSEGFDVHSYTARVITEAGQETSRQVAKTHCVTMDTEILTPVGWKLYDQISIGDTVLTYNAETKMTEWQPILEISQFKDQEVWHYGHSHWKVKTTPNHRWYGFRRRENNEVKSLVDCVFTAQDINSEYSIITAAPCNDAGQLSITPKDAAILGWILCDGSYTFKGRTQAVVIQKKVLQSNILDVLLAEVISGKSHKGHGSFVWRIKAKEFRRIWEAAELDETSPDFVKFITHCSPEARREFLNSCVLAEGNKREYGQFRVSQNQGSLADAIRIGFTLEGNGTTVTTRLSRTGKFHDIYTVRKKSHVTCQRFSVSGVSTQDVWCPRTSNGTWVMRQGKTVTITGNTFAPLYGATGYGRTPAEAAYYTHFMDKYKGVAKWHKTLATQAVGYKFIKIPSGREYAFPNVQRKRDGSVTFFTQIKNYPVQGFATADIVPLALVEIFNRLKPYRSCVVNSVHDSIVIDVHPEEVESVVELVDSVQNDLIGLINRRWDIDFNVPLALEAKIGNTWLDQTEVKH